MDQNKISRTRSGSMAEAHTLWVLAYDSEYERDYYFNIETQEALWENPKGMETCEFRRYEDVYPEEETQADEEISKEDSPSPVQGWHYMDVHGEYQGPFDVQQLRGWRDQFPMNTRLWRRDQLKEQQQQHEESTSTQKSTYLADILEDHELLAKWQKETPHHEQKTAPTASSYEHLLKFPTAHDPLEELLADDGNQHQTSELSYADAVLAGLPDDDETVQLADMAKQTGQSLKDVVDFVHAAAADLTKHQMVIKDPYTGKMQVVADEADESKELYAEFGSWIDPAKMEEGLKKSAQYRREKLPAIWKRTIGVKKRKAPEKDDD